MATPTPNPRGLTVRRGDPRFETRGNHPVTPVPTEEWQNSFATATAAAPTPSVTPYPIGTLTPLEKGVVKEVTAGGMNSIRKLIEARLGVKIPKGTIPDRVLSFMARQGSQRINPAAEKLLSETKRGMVESAIHRTETEPGVQAVRRMQEKTDEEAQPGGNGVKFQHARGEYHAYPNVWTYNPNTPSFEASTARSSEIRPPSRKYSEQLRDNPKEVRDDLSQTDFFEETPRSSFDESEENEEELKQPPKSWKAKGKEKTYGQRPQTKEECERLPTERERRRCRKRKRQQSRG